MQSMNCCQLCCSLQLCCKLQHSWQQMLSGSRRGTGRLPVRILQDTDTVMAMLTVSVYSQCRRKILFHINHEQFQRWCPPSPFLKIPTLYTCRLYQQQAWVRVCQRSWDRRYLVDGNGFAGMPGAVATRDVSVLRNEKWHNGNVPNWLSNDLVTLCSYCRNYTKYQNQKI